jgi:hypothetical protein
VTIDATAVFRAYLVAWTFWAGIGLGAMGIIFIQYLTGGNWGLATRRIFEAAAATVPLMSVLFVPVLFGLPYLYAWARPADVSADAILQHKALYLNVPFFIVRAVFYLVVWSVLAALLRRWSGGELVRLQKFSIVGAIVLGLTVSLAAIDWLMSLDADWYSTMYPPLVAMSFLLCAFAFGIIVLVRLAPRTELGEIVAPQLFNDLGNLLLAFLMLWAYMQYFQYLLIWAGNLSDEIPFYVRRTEGGWQPYATFVAVAGFFIPFWFLLFRPLKRNPRTLAWIAGLVVVMHVVNVYWLIAPPFEPAGPTPGVLDVVALIVMGAVWLAAFVWRIRAQPLLARSDVRMQTALEAAHETA